MGFCHYAQSYRLAAEALQRAGKTAATHQDAPIRFLCYHAIEMYLKAFLRMHGYTPKDLAGRKFGHNTITLSNEVGKLGVQFDDEDIVIFRIMGKTDAVIRSRYIQTGAVHWPTLEGLSRTCESLRALIGEALRKRDIDVRM